MIAGKGEDLTEQSKGKFNNKEIKLLLKWKTGKSSNKGKDEMVAMYVRAPARAASAAAEWTAEDESRPERLKQVDVALRDTAIGSAAKQNVNAVINNIEHTAPEDRQKLLQVLNNNSEM